LEWQALARTIGFTHEGAPLEGQNFDWRRANGDEIDTAMCDWTEQRESLAVQKELQAAGIPAYVVATSRDLHEDRQLHARSHFVKLDHPKMGLHAYEMPPYRLREHEITPERSPLIGEHTFEVLRDCLGMTQEEITEAKESGALE
jgi:benzylsuccinate CoA-transferase BbsF subunit